MNQRNLEKQEGKATKKQKEPIIINPSLRLVPYYPAYDAALPWYQDAELCHQVDNQDRIYDLSILKNMYQYLDSHGELFYIESEGVLCGDVCLQTSGEISIVICKEYQNRHIGRSVAEKILELARKKRISGMLCRNLCVQYTVTENVRIHRLSSNRGRSIRLQLTRKGDFIMTKLTLDEKKELIRMALKAREGAYVPYSDFMVGAALRAEDGRVFTGCNVENAAFTPTSCAERTALFKAVSEGVTKFTDIAVVGARRGEVNKQITSPCGVCRQALFEFGGPELNVIMAKTPDDFIERSMDELLPFGFGPSNVAGNKAVEE